MVKREIGDEVRNFDVGGYYSNFQCLIPFRYLSSNISVEILRFFLQKIHIDAKDDCKGGLTVWRT